MGLGHGQAADWIVCLLRQRRVGGQLADPPQHGVDKAGRAGIEPGLGQIDAGVDRRPVGHLIQLENLVGPQPEEALHLRFYL